MQQRTECLPHKGTAAVYVFACSLCLCDSQLLRGLPVRCRRKVVVVTACFALVSLQQQAWDQSAHTGSQIVRSGM